MSKVRIQHTRACGYCRKGVKKFFDGIGVNWDAFLKEGIPEKTLLDTNNVMATKVVEKKRQMDDA